MLVPNKNRLLDILIKDFRLHILIYDLNLICFAPIKTYCNSQLFFFDCSTSTHTDTEHVRARAHTHAHSLVPPHISTRLSRATNALSFSPNLVLFRFLSLNSKLQKQVLAGIGFCLLQTGNRLLRMQSLVIRRRLDC